MAETANFDFESNLDEYRNRISEWKDTASRIINADGPADAFRSAAELIGTPVGVEMLRNGISNYLSPIGASKDALKKAAEDKLSTLKSTLQDAKSRIQTGVQDVVDRAGEAIHPDALKLKADVQGKLRELGRDDLADTIEDPASQREALGLLRNADPADSESATLGERMDQLARQRWSADPYAQPETTVDSNLPVGANIELTDFVQDGESAGRAFENVGARLGENADAITSRFSGLQNVISRLGNPDTAMTGSDSTIARALAGARQQATDALGQVTDRITTAGQQVELGISRNAAAVSKITGITDPTEALQATEGLSAIAPEALATEEGLTSGLTGGLAAGLEATGEGIIAGTGAETEGIGAIVGGLIALGGVFAGIFSPHKDKEQAPNIPIPNFSRPVLQTGLGN